jgi:hypothetical protein
MNLRKVFATLWLAAFLALPAALLFGQALKGTILGTVTGVTHAVVPNVSVNVTERSTPITTARKSAMKAASSRSPISTRGDPPNWRVVVDVIKASGARANPDCETSRTKRIATPGCA